MKNTYTHAHTPFRENACLLEPKGNGKRKSPYWKICVNLRLVWSMLVFPVGMHVPRPLLIIAPAEAESKWPKMCNCMAQTLLCSSRAGHLPQDSPCAVSSLSVSHLIPFKDTWNQVRYAVPFSRKVLPYYCFHVIPSYLQTTASYLCWLIRDNKSLDCMRPSSRYVSEPPLTHTFPFIALWKGSSILFHFISFVSEEMDRCLHFQQLSHTANSC